MYFSKDADSVPTFESPWIHRGWTLAPFFVGKGIPAFPSHLKRRRPQLDTPEELQWSCHNSKDPDVPIHSRYT